MNTTRPVALEELREQVRQAIADCLRASGRSMPSLRGQQCPLTSIDGFDSLCGIEVTVDLGQRLAIDLEDNVFIKTVGGGPKARTLDEVIQAVANAIRHQGG